MAYGIGTRAPIADDASSDLAAACAGRPISRCWQALDPDRRLALIEQRLRPANDLTDGYPAAL